jgi:hypothetical protein
MVQGRKDRAGTGTTKSPYKGAATGPERTNRTIGSTNDRNQGEKSVLLAGLAM